MVVGAFSRISRFVCCFHFAFSSGCLPRLSSSLSTPELPTAVFREKRREDETRRETNHQDDHSSCTLISSIHMVTNVSALFFVRKRCVFR
jgi:hypothetical protein